MLARSASVARSAASRAAWRSSVFRTSERPARSRTSTLETNIPRRGIHLDEALARERAQRLAHGGAAELEPFHGARAR